MPFFPFKAPTSGGGSSFERLCYVEYVMNDTPEKPTILTLDSGENYNVYLSYNPTTKVFTVLRDFTAIINAWVKQYQNACSRGQGAFYINNVQVMGVFVTPESLGGSKAGETDFFNLHAGDTFYSYTPSSNGWPQQHLKVYKVEDLPVTDIKDFNDENT